MSIVRSEALELFAGALDWLTDDFVVAFMNDGYTYSAAHDRLNDISSDVEDSIAVTSGKAVTLGVLSADDPADHTFPSPGVVLIGAWLYHDTGTPSTSELLAWYDHRSSGLSFVVTTTASPMTVRWPADRFGAGFISL